ncbi:hypothetical protein BJV82DRAFT_587449 [Fennellomyces sp. T-0311]|nr:hypothetical protein BJV82DRAFT_587449 [Fennellomyces sp. T-0311]
MSEQLLLVFVHGFRGGDTTFKDFPDRLKTIATHANVQIKIYPRYKTAGDFQLAVQNLLSWLQTQAQEQRKNGANKVQIVLLGHSMGGLVSAEAIIHCKEHPGVLDAEILGLIAYDSPFYSVNHRFLTTQALTHAEQLNRHVSRFWPSATTTAAATRSTAATASKAVAKIEYPAAATKKSSGSSWGLLAGVVGVAAVGAAAYIAREKIQATMTDAFDHLEFVSTLMDLEGCWER